MESSQKHGFEGPALAVGTCEWESEWGMESAWLCAKLYVLWYLCTFNILSILFTEYFYFIYWVYLIYWVFTEYTLCGRPHTGEWAGYKGKDRVHAPKEFPLYQGSMTNPQTILTPDHAGYVSQYMYLKCPANFTQFQRTLGVSKIIV